MESVASNLSASASEEGTYVPILSRTPSFYDIDEKNLPAPDLECTMKAAKDLSKSVFAEKEKETMKRVMEQKTYLTNRIDTAEALSPFKLKRVYGRLDNVPAISLTGLYKNSILYAASNAIVILDYVENTQKCLQAHKNVITTLAHEKKMRFFATGDGGEDSLLAIWDLVQAKPIKIFEKPHERHGVACVTFTGVDYVVVTLGNEEAGKQTICFWDFEPKSENKRPLYTKALPEKATHVRDMCFCEERLEFFAITGDFTILCCTWLGESDDENREDRVFIHRPDLRSGFLKKQKKFTCSLWMPETRGQWLATATMAGYVLLWSTPVVFGLDDPPDPAKNIKELKKFYKVSDVGLTFMTVFREYLVVGDVAGLVRFYDSDFKMLRFTNLKSKTLPAINSVSFNITFTPAFKNETITDFDERRKFDFLKKDENSCVRDYTLGKNKTYSQASKTTIERGPFNCPDFVIGTKGGDVYYYHLSENKLDLLVQGCANNYVACDICPGSPHVLFVTREGDAQLYDYTTHKILFSDRIFEGHHKVSTFKFHPTGQFVIFGLMDGRLSFRFNYTWVTFIPPIHVGKDQIKDMCLSHDGLFLCYYDAGNILFILRYSPKVKKWYLKSRLHPHLGNIMDVKFFHDMTLKQDRLFSLGSDRRLVEYDLRAQDDADGKSKILKVIYVEQCYMPTAMVFDSSSEFGPHCMTFANELNKLRIFNFAEEKVERTCAGPVFGRNVTIKNLLEFPAVIGARQKKFIIYTVRNKLGMIDTPVDGNPHKYMGVLAHPEDIVGVTIAPHSNLIFTLGAHDNCAFEWEADFRAAEALVLMGGTGHQPYYYNLRRIWGERCQDIIEDIALIFFYLNMKRIDRQEDIFSVKNSIRLIEIPAVCRALGFFPSELEVDMILLEARRAKMKDKLYTNDSKTEVDIDLFIKLFSNHYYLTTKEDIKNALVALGFPPLKERSGLPPYYRSEQFIRYLMTEGEPIRVNEYPTCLRALFGEQEMIPDDSTYTPYESMSSDTLYGNMDGTYESSDYLGSGGSTRQKPEGFDLSSDESVEDVEEGGTKNIPEDENEHTKTESDNSSEPRAIFTADYNNIDDEFEEEDTEASAEMESGSVLLPKKTAANIISLSEDEEEE